MKAIFVFSLALFAWSACADPTRPPASFSAPSDASTPAASGLPRLQLIMQTALGYQAMLDGKLVRTGERYLQYQVLKIDAERIILTSDQGQLQLFIHNNKIKIYEP